MVKDLKERMNDFSENLNTEVVHKKKDIDAIKKKVRNEEYNF